MAHNTFVRSLLASHMATLNHKGNEAMYSSCVPRKKMKQIYGEQLAASVTHPVNWMKLTSREAGVICPLQHSALEPLSNMSG